MAFGMYECKVCGKEYDNMLVDCPHCSKTDKKTQKDLSDKFDLVQGGRVFNNVKIIDFDMEFGSMVVFMVKWVIASIPAIIILFFIFVIFNIITTGMGLGIAKMFQ